jgi:hypothetical protein
LKDVPSTREKRILFLVFEHVILYLTAPTRLEVLPSELRTKST